MKALARKAWHLLPQRVRYGVGQWLFRCHASIMAVIDLWGEYWYGVDSTSRVPGAAAPDSNPNKPLNYYRIYFLRRRLGIDPADVVADIGSGSGRVLWVFAGSGAKIRGIELGEQAVAKCRDNISRLRNQNHRIEVILADAGEFTFTDETIVYLFNPFGPPTIKRVLQNLKESLDRNPRRLRICVYNSPDRGLYDQTPWLRLQSVIDFYNGDFLVYENVPSAAGVSPSQDRLAAAR